LFNAGEFFRVQHQFWRNPLAAGIVFIECEKERAFPVRAVHYEPCVRCLDPGEVEEVVALEESIVRDGRCGAGNDGDSIRNLIHQTRPAARVLRIIYQAPGANEGDFGRLFFAGRTSHRQESERGQQERGQDCDSLVL
jgi:hypothetical protein